MAATSPREIVDAILQAIEEGGYSAAFLNERMAGNPKQFAISLPENQFVKVWVYIWTLTHGGRENLPDEYRIQTTSVDSPLTMNPDGLTVLMGYEPNLGLFAGFDLERHKTFTGGSPSVQIDINAVRLSLDQGLTFDRKSNDEIAIGVRPDHLVDYFNNAGELHRLGRFADTLPLLVRATAQKPIPAADIAALATPRRVIVETIRRLSRSGSFRQQVLQAYGNRCAVTRAQLRLVDAAHILPVGSPESSDDVRNGLALAPTYHRAFDAGLIYVDEKYTMQINKARVGELQGLKLDGGLKEFASYLGKIHLPADKRQWPEPAFIKRANKYRNVG
jgi:putative restriction endonuclease